jgi:hypothetical protein
MRKGIPTGIILVSAVVLVVALVAIAQGPGPTSAGSVDAYAYPTIPLETIPPPTQTPQPTNTALPMPTRTPQPTTTPGSPTELPQPTLTEEPEPTVPPNIEVVDVCDDPPAPIPAPWVGVVDYLLENVYANGVCQGVWIANSNDSLFENSDARTRVEANNVSEGDKRPADPADNVYIARPTCLANGQWVYVAGTWFYNGIAHVVTDPGVYWAELVHYTYPEDFDVLRNHHHTSVPVPAYDSHTWWNFAAQYTCEQQGGPEPPQPPPPPPPTPTPPPAECPSCVISVSPAGSLEAPYLSQDRSLTLTWSCAHDPGADLTGYVVRVWANAGSEWLPFGEPHRIGPEEPRQVALEIPTDVLYRAQVEGHFNVNGNEEGCCAGDTYYRYSFEVEPPTHTAEARVEYWSEHDPDYPIHGPDNPYRTSGPLMNWNYGEVLHAHPTVEFENSAPPSPAWTVLTSILKWRYRGGTTTRWHEWHAAECNPPEAPSCDWQDELPRQYMHLRWYKHLLPGETEGVAEGDSRQWVYATDPLTVTFSYQVQAETIWTNTQTGFQITWPPFTETLTMTVRLRYLSTYRGGR